MPVDYVTGPAAPRAVLRPLRYPLYDSEHFTNGQTDDLILFKSASKFKDGTDKNACDTNMQADGHLGHPLWYDLAGFTAELEWGVEQADFNEIYNNNTFEWFFGQSTSYLLTTLKKIPQGNGPWGFASAGTVITSGIPSVNNFFMFTTPDKKARSISPVEQFRCVISPCEALSLTATHKITVYLHGILYANI